MTRKNLVLIVITILVFAVAVKYISQNTASFKRIFEITPYQACVFFVLQFTSISINAFMLIALLSVFGVKASFRDFLALASVNTFLNHIFIKSGILAKGFFLKRIHNLSYIDFAVSISSLVLVNFMVAGVLGTYLLLFLFATRGNFSPFLFTAFIMMSAGSFIFIKLFGIKRKVNETDNVFIRKSKEMSNSWHVLGTDKRAMTGVCALTFLHFVVYALRLKYGFHVLYGDVPMTDCMVISILGVLSTLVGITPASLGIREFMVGAGYSLIKGDMLQAVVATTLDRMVSLVLIFTMGIVSCFYLLKKSNDVSVVKNEKGG